MESVLLLMSTATTMSGAAMMLQIRMNHSIHRWSPLLCTSQSPTNPPVTMPTAPKIPPTCAMDSPAFFTVMSCDRTRNIGRNAMMLKPTPTWIITPMDRWMNVARLRRCSNVSLTPRHISAQNALDVNVAAVLAADGLPPASASSPGTLWYLPMDCSTGGSSSVSTMIAASTNPGMPSTPKTPLHPSESMSIPPMKLAAAAPTARPSCCMAIALARWPGPYMTAMSDCAAGVHPASPSPIPTRRKHSCVVFWERPLRDVSVDHTMSETARRYLRPHMSAMRANGIVASA